MPTDFICATCRFAIAGRPTFHLGLAFCCAGCAADGPCICTYDQDDRDEVELVPAAAAADAAPLPAGSPALIGAHR